MKRVILTVRVAAHQAAGALAALTGRGIRARTDGGHGDGDTVAVAAEAEIVEGSMAESARRELAAKVSAALGDEGIAFDEVRYDESAGPEDTLKFRVTGVDSDGRTVEFFAPDWDAFDQQFEAVFGRQRRPEDQVEAERLTR